MDIELRIQIGASMIERDRAISVRTKMNRARYLLYARQSVIMTLAHSQYARIPTALKNDA